MGKRFKITVNIIDGNILQFPQELWFDCDLVKPADEGVIRQFNSSECIVSRKSFLFTYQGRRFGTGEFSTLQEFITYRNANCVTAADDPCCYLTFGGCFITYNGSNISHGVQ